MALQVAVRTKTVPELSIVPADEVALNTISSQSNDQKVKHDFLQFIAVIDFAWSLIMTSFKLAQEISRNHAVLNSLQAEWRIYASLNHGTFGLDNGIVLIRSLRKH